MLDDEAPSAWDRAMDPRDREIERLRAALQIIADSRPGAMPSVDWQCLCCISLAETAETALVSEPAATPSTTGEGE